MKDTMHSFCPVLHKSPRLSLVSAGPYDACAGKDMPLHCHDSWEVIYYREGDIDSIVGDEVIPGRPGTVVAIPPRVAHAEHSSTGYANFWIQIQTPQDHPWPRVCFDDEHAAFHAVCSSLAREARGESHCREQMLGLLTAQLDILLQRQVEQLRISGDERLVRQAQQIMQERYRNTVRICDVATELGISPSFLRELFVELRGQSPSSYLQSLRLQHALGILRNTDFGLETVASISGYDSASHLSRHVKRATGHTPGSLRPARL